MLLTRGYLANAKWNIFTRGLVNLIRKSLKCKLGVGVGKSHMKVYNWILSMY